MPLSYRAEELFSFVGGQRSCEIPVGEMLKNHNQCFSRKAALIIQIADNSHTWHVGRQYV